MRRERSDEGGATVFAVVAMTALVAVTALILQIGAAAVARQRAASAADSAALAGAMEVLRGAEAACGRARDIAALNDARLDSCEVLGLDVRVVVSADAPLAGGRAVARARAGPV